MARDAEVLKKYIYKTYKIGTISVTDVTAANLTGKARSKHEKHVKDARRAAARMLEHAMAWVKDIG